MCGTLCRHLNTWNPLLTVHDLCGNFFLFSIVVPHVTWIAFGFWIVLFVVWTSGERGVEEGVCAVLMSIVGSVLSFWCSMVALLLGVGVVLGGCV